MNKFIFDRNGKLHYLEEAMLIYGEHKFPKAFVMSTPYFMDKMVINCNAYIKFTIYVKDEETPTVVNIPIEWKEINNTSLISENIEFTNDIIIGIGQIIANLYLVDENDSTIIAISEPCIINIHDRITGDIVPITPGGGGGGGDATIVKVKGKNITKNGIADLMTESEYDEETNKFILQEELQNEQMERIESIQTTQSMIEAEELARIESESQLEAKIDENTGNIDDILELVPSTATSDNKLTDKEFVNHSIATETAHYMGTYDSEEKLPTEGVTNNDYAWVVKPSPTQQGKNIYTRWKYNDRDKEWKPEYSFANVEFTAEQWAAINSGMTATEKAQFAAAIASLQTNKADKSTTYTMTEVDALLETKATDSDVVHLSNNPNDLKIYTPQGFKFDLNQSLSYPSYYFYAKPYSSSLIQNRYAAFVPIGSTPWGSFQWGLEERYEGTVIQYGIGGIIYNKDYKIEFPKESGTFATREYVQEQIAAITDYEEVEF